jgi:energy-coupling factor transport system permease protein
VHPVAWLSWVSLVMVLALVTTNPYYLAIVLLCVLLVAALAPWSATGFASFRLMLTLGVAIGVFSIAVAAINGASGEHVLFDVPGPRFPEWFGGLRLGGPVTLEALAGASLRALATLCVFLAFAVFSGAVSPARLLRLAPASLFHASLIVTVGLTLLPSIIQDTRRIREMQLLRGASGRLRHLPGLIVPAILGGLDRSLRLAEAMEARGYAASPPPTALARLAGIAATPGFLAAAWFWFYTESLELVALPLAVAGIASLTLWLRAAALGRSTTRLHDDPVPAAQAMVAGLTFALAVALPFLRAQEAIGFAYNPFAGLPAPSFAALPAAIALLAAWPAAFLIHEAPDPRAMKDAPALSRDEALLR